MEFTNEFRVPADVDTTFATLTDLERVAPCMPGAVLEEANGNTYTGRMRVRLGPIQVDYRGTAEVTDIDEAAKTAAIVASGRETRGAGTAKANVSASLRPDGQETLVSVVSQIDVTGKPAQFGRGVMADVGERIIGQFAERLQTMLAEEQEPAPASAAEASTGGPRRIRQDASRADDALDLMEVAGAATLKRLAPIAATGLAVLLLWWLRRRRHRGGK